MKTSTFEELAAHGVLTFGDISFRGKCPQEGAEQATFFNALRREYPDTFGAIAIHPRNEGQLRGGQFGVMSKKKAEGMTAGAVDIIIPARIPFVCEMKRQNHTLSKWQDGQQEYLIATAGVGAFACVALGYKSAWQALEYWIAQND